MVRVGIAPYTGARLQYIAVHGAASTSFSCGSRGVRCIRGLADPSTVFTTFPSFVVATDTVDEVEPLLLVLDRVSDDDRPRERDEPDDFRVLPERVPELLEDPGTFNVDDEPDPEPLK